jgi:hypothetical protein
MTKEPTPLPAGAHRKAPANEMNKKKRLADALRQNLAKRKDKKAVDPQGETGAD